MILIFMNLKMPEISRISLKYPSKSPIFLNININNFTENNLKRGRYISPRLTFWYTVQSKSLFKVGWQFPPFVMNIHGQKNDIPPPFFCSTRPERLDIQDLFHRVGERPGWGGGEDAAPPAVCGTLTAAEALTHLRLPRHFSDTGAPAGEVPACFFGTLWPLILWCWWSSFLHDPWDTLEALLALRKSNCSLETFGTLWFGRKTCTF